MRTSRTRSWLARTSAAALALGVVAVVGQTPATANPPVTGAVSTTTNIDADKQGGTLGDVCGNGNPSSTDDAVNCNIYKNKKYVWLSGLPDSAGINDGTYFFAVLVPGGQGANADANPNDGTDKNLSDLVAAPYVLGDHNADGSAIPSGDSYLNRTFEVANGVIAYSGSHEFVDNKIRVFPYDDTTNPGGVYILAVCKISGLTPTGSYLPGVDPSVCKYDAFKVDDGGGTVIPPASDLTVVKDATGSYTTSYDWKISKVADKTRIEQSGTDATFNYTVSVSHSTGQVSAVKVTGTITVFNPNKAEVTGVDVTDELSDGTGCTVTGGQDATIPAADGSGNGEASFPYVCTLGGLPSDSLANTVTAAWPDQDLGDNGFLLGSYAQFAFDNDGYGIAFTNTVVDSSINVTDSYAGSLGTVTVSDANPTTLTYSRTVTGTPGTCTTYDNTATFTTSTTGTTGSAEKEVTLCVGADLTVSKSFDPSFTRTYRWKIGKSVDKTTVSGSGGSDITLNYTVKAEQTGFADSAFEGSGTITIANPNDWEDITADVADVLSGGTAGSSCTPDDTSVLVPAGESVDVGYTCTFTGGGSGTNTATATWDAAAYSTPTGEASDDVDVAFTTPTATVDKTIHVTDPMYTGGTPAGTLGTLTGTDAAPYASATYTYSKTVKVLTNACFTVDNTATITETGQAKDAHSRVCSNDAGGLTMGFWQNKNGQGIITGGTADPVTKVCASGTYLRTFAPFQDLSATAKCSDVATYVTGVIKAANASGAAMNAMLKGQMLATALDVYYGSGVGPDGAKAKPYNGNVTGLGGVKIDISSWSGAFGGATSMTVSNMLTYAAGKSNVGGSAWYGQIKATQGLAKDAFDAINNGKAVVAP